MTISVEIVKTGYSFVDNDKNIMKANCTCTLVKEGSISVIVDTLTAWDGAFLLNELEKKGLKPSEITHAIATHGHSDHIGNLNLFTNALHIVGQSVSRQDEYLLHNFEDQPYKISENIEVIATPGHTLSDVSIIVKNTALGVVAIVGDLFEKQEDISNPHVWQVIAGSENEDLQFKNREKILNSVDYIIPGHGPGFVVTEGLRGIHKSTKLSALALAVEEPRAEEK
ncbi:metallo-beta-lactamase domain-containing protein 1-like [Uloborus diversus]|uniref:metallo-beta-lactamase domain-containing protein 1-like n=1 Tax=Uloborus diversus TaxID=327109 RepID=UPI00240A5DE2|nr:metallo-beta-lactamase domain-containing protein 1-like [Uloborus diversus]